MNFVAMQFGISVIAFWEHDVLASCFVEITFTVAVLITFWSLPLTTFEFTAKHLSHYMSENKYFRKL